MRWKFAPALPALAILATSAAAGRPPIIRDPVALNIGVNCQWESGCMKRQRAAMNHALRFVAEHRPPQWRVEQCNRNAGRGPDRMDWVGFDHCIQNASLKYAPRRKRLPRRVVS